MSTPPALPAGPPCAACGEPASVNWQRRPTADEVSDLIATEVERRQQALLHADPQLPVPEFGPLPTGDGMTRTVYACHLHAIGLDSAACIHESTCTAPDPALLPGCGCTPETPVQTPFARVSRLQLPAHWTTARE
jgi:hypothetical protein